MNSKLIIHEFKSSLKVFINFSIIIFAILISSFIIYNNISDTTFDKIDNLNKNLKIILFINNLSNIDEYYCFIMEYLIIIGALMASVLASKQFLEDRKYQYDEYLFTLPISRTKLFLNKCFVVFIELISFNILFYVISIILSHTIVHIPMIHILKINSTMILNQITFAGLGFLVSALFKTPRLILLKSILLILIFLLIAIPERVFNIILIKYINPFSYLAIRDIILTTTYKYSFLIASGFITIFSLTISGSIYKEYEV